MAAEWLHTFRGSEIVLPCHVIQSLVSHCGSRSWTQDFPLSTFEMTECLGDVADLLRERFHFPEKKN